MVILQTGIMHIAAMLYALTHVYIFKECRIRSFSSGHSLLSLVQYSVPSFASVQTWMMVAGGRGHAGGGILAVPAVVLHHLRLVHERDVAPGLFLASVQLTSRVHTKS